SDLLKQVVMAVQQGELWIRRTLTSRLAKELGEITGKNKAYQASNGLLNKLTQREYDIALHVANGESNKTIAQMCAITERTVKAHLSEVFHKLGVPDRLKLALVLSGDNKNHDQ
ncbi:MAG: LuxR C-terminal-related transcriptional regulator, partial [Gallionella sp.]